MIQLFTNNRRGGTRPQQQHVSVLILHFCGSRQHLSVTQHCGDSSHKSQHNKQSRLRSRQLWQTDRVSAGAVDWGGFLSVDKNNLHSNQFAL